MKELIDLADQSIVIERNELLKVKGTVDTNTYFVESGSLKVFVLDNDEEQIIRFGYQNNLIACIDSFLTNKPSNFYIQAIKKSTLRVIRKPQIIEFIESNESNRILWLKIMENLVLQQMEREIDILTSSPKERYLRVLERSPQLFQEIPNRYIANYLRMSPETLSRLKKS